MRFKSKLIGLTAAGIFLVLQTSALAAGAASISISGGGSYSVGNTFTTTILESSTQAVNGVKVGVQYNASMLQVVGSPTIGDFSTCPSGVAVSGGLVSWECAALGGQLTGSHPVGTITFKALVAGSSVISTTSGTVITDAVTANQNDWNGSSASSNITVNAPSAPSTPSQSTKSSPSTVRSSSNSSSQNSGKVSNSTVSKPTTTVSSTSTNTPSGSVKGATTTKNSAAKVATLMTTKTSHTSLITSGISALLIVIAAAYWLFFRKPTEVVPATVAVAKNKKKAVAPAKAKHTAVKPARAKTTKSKASTSKKK